MAGVSNASTAKGEPANATPGTRLDFASLFRTKLCSKRKFCIDFDEFLHKISKNVRCSACHLGVSWNDGSDMRGFRNLFVFTILM